MDRKTSTTKLVTKIHMESGRKGIVEVIRLGPVPPGEDSEEKGDYMGGDLPWGVSSLRHILGAPDLRSDKGKMTLPHPCLWLVGGPVGLIRRLWETWTLLMRHTKMLACF